MGQGYTQPIQDDINYWCQDHQGHDWGGLTFFKWNIVQHMCNFLKRICHFSTLENFLSPSPVENGKFAPQNCAYAFPENFLSPKFGYYG